MKPWVKWVLNIVAVLLIWMGGVWFLQDINVLPGSFMTGQTRWSITGSIAPLAGLALLVVANRRRGAPPAR